MTALRAPPREKFRDPDLTADGARRARVAFSRLETLWVNTGTLCNIECADCYIESSPRNDRLVYVTAGEIAPFIDEAARLGAKEIGFTGGEPFMNPDIIQLLAAALARGLSVLVLTNAMRPMLRPRVREGLLQLALAHEGRLVLRASLDHYTAALHDRERGAGGFEATMAGMNWLHRKGVALAVAGRLKWDEREAETRAGYAALFSARGLDIDANDPARLVLFPEMNAAQDTPEITESCWEILGRNPQSVMCATSRMVVKRKGAAAPSVVACTLLPYAEEFELGGSLDAALGPVALNHPHCSRFCVLGGASCTP